MQTSEESREVVSPQPMTQAPDAGAPETRHEVEHEHVHLPPPSIWPMSLAGGTAIGGLGLVTIPYISILGLVIMALSLIYWIQELRHEPH